MDTSFMDRRHMYHGTTRGQWERSDEKNRKQIVNHHFQDPIQHEAKKMEEEQDGNGNPLFIELVKRIRATKKKLDRIEIIEARIDSGKVKKGALELELKNLLESKPTLLVAQKEFDSLRIRFNGILSSSLQPADVEAKLPKAGSKSPKLQFVTVQHPDYPDLLVTVEINPEASVVEMLAKVQEAKDGIVSNSEAMAEAVAVAEAKARVQLAETEEAFSLAKKKWERGLEKSKKEAEIGIQNLMTMLLIHQLYPGLPSAGREPLPEVLTFLGNSILGSASSPEDSFEDIVKQSKIEAIK